MKNPLHFNQNVMDCYYYTIKYFESINFLLELKNKIVITFVNLILFYTYISESYRWR